MNNIFKLKRKLHSFINSLFYFIFFLFGYFLGGVRFEKVIDVFNNIFNF